MPQKQIHALHKNKTRAELVRELEEIQAKLSASQQICREQGEELVRIRSINEVSPGEHHSEVPSLWENEINLNLTLKSSKIVPARFDRELRYQSIHNRHSDFVSSHVIGKRDDELEDSKGATRLMALKRQVIDSGMGANEEISFHRSDGTRTYDVLIEPLFDSKRTITGGVSVAYDITERKLAEQALRESEERFRTMADGLPLSVWVHDPEGRQQFVNRTFLDFFGVTLEEMQGGRWQLLMHPDEEAAYAAELAACIHEQRSFNAQVRVQHADGGWRWIEYWGRPRLSPTGEYLGYVGTSVDITERKTTEQTLQESESFYRQTLESIPGMVFTTFPDGYCDYQSRQWVDYTGVPMNQHLGEGWNRLLHPEDQSRALGVWQKALKGASDYDLEYRVRRHDGAFEWFRAIAHPIRDDGGKIVRWFGVAMNIEALKQTEEELLTKTKRLELLATVADVLLASEDPRLIIENLCRRVMAHLDCQFFFNYLVEKPGHYMGLNAYAGIPPEAAAAIRQLDFGVAVCGCVARDGKRIIAEDIQNSDDPRVQVVKRYGVKAYCCHPLMAQEKAIGTLSFGTLTRKRFTPDEISLMKSIADQAAVAMQRLQTEKMLQELNKTLTQEVARRTDISEGRARQLQALAIELIEAEEKERERIALLLHDDLQQLLASAKMQLQAACETIPPDPFLSNVNKLLAESLIKSRRLAHELSPPVLQHADIVSAIKWLVQRMNVQFGIIVEFRTGKVESFENPPLKVLVFRAAQELLFNIVKHSGVRKAELDLSVSQNMLVVSISDQGKGFDPALLNNTKASFGMGLVSLRERVSYMGGTFSIKSAPGKGSRFTLTLPFGNIIKAPKPVPVHVPEEGTGRERSAGGQKIRVVLADDHKLLRQGLAGLISSQPNIEVVGEASNGRQAIELVRQLDPELVLMDISMPDMDGIEATRILNSEMPHVCIVGLSMFEDEQILKAMHLSGAKTYISKTASTSELFTAIYKALEQ